MNERLSPDIIERLRSQPRLSGNSINQLYVDYMPEPDQAAVRIIACGLQRLMSGITHSPSHTGALAGGFHQTLSRLAESLDTPGDQQALSPLVSVPLDIPAEMQDSVETLRRRVEDGQSEIQRLRTALRLEREQSLLDPLTHVLNRKGFDLKISRLLAMPPADQPQHHLLLVDIDHFKTVNDTYGHVMGDRVLQVLGDILRTFANDATITAARYGGEEFALLISGRSEVDALRFSEHVREKINSVKIRDRRNQGVLFGITISIGLTPLCQAEEPSTTVARADTALYAAKIGGRNRVSYSR